MEGLMGLFWLLIGLAASLYLLVSSRKSATSSPPPPELSTLYAPSLDEARRPADIRVTSLHVYPVKGCRGISLQEAKILNTGIKYGKLSFLIIF